MEERSKLRKIYLTGGGEGAVGILRDGSTVTKYDPPPLKLASSKPLCEQAKADRTAAQQPSDFGEAVTLMLKQGHDPRKAIEAAATRWPTLYQRYCDELQRIE